MSVRIPISPFVLFLFMRSVAARLFNYVLKIAVVANV